MRAALVTLLLSTALCSYGQGAPPYRPETLVSGTIRSWGSAQMAEVMALWEGGFQRYHPAVRFEDKLNGTVSGMGGLYSRAADLALMGREIWPSEATAYEQTAGHPATGIQVAMGSFDVPTKADALVVFVHRDNPIATLSLGQLRSLFGCASRECGSASQRWGEVGLTGEWADKPIHAYGYKLDNAAAIFFKSVVLKDEERHCGIKTFANQTSQSGRRIDSGQLILNALASDPYGIAISNPHYAGPEVRAVALAAENGVPAIPPTRGAIASGKY